MRLKYEPSEPLHISVARYAPSRPAAERRANTGTGLENKYGEIPGEHPQKFKAARVLEFEEEASGLTLNPKLLTRNRKSGACGTRGSFGASCRRASRLPQRFPRCRHCRCRHDKITPVDADMTRFPRCRHCGCRHDKMTPASTSSRQIDRGTSLIRNSDELGPCSRTVPKALWWSWGGWRFLMSEVPL
jgi:hypothetical protein